MFEGDRITAKRILYCQSYRDLDLPLALMENTFFLVDVNQTSDKQNRMIPFEKKTISFKMLQTHPVGPI